MCVCLLIKYGNDYGGEGEDKGKGVPNLQYFIHIHYGIMYKGLPPVQNDDFPAQWEVV